MAHVYYGAHQLLINKFTLERLTRGVEYKLYKAIIVKQLKLALGLPKKGKVEPLLSLFFNYDPKNIIIQNYLQQLEKYTNSQLIKDKDTNPLKLDKEEL